MSWIHRRDWLSIVDILLNNPALNGAFNATAPQPVTNLEFSNSLAKQLHQTSVTAYARHFIENCYWAKCPNWCWVVNG